MDKLEQFLRNEFVTELESHPRLADLVRELNHHVQIFVFGGWCRDKIHSCVYNQSIAWSDIDLVVDGELDESLFRGFSRTKFGGFRTHLKGSKLVDFWPLKESLAFRTNLFAPSINNLLKTTIFDVNSVLFDVNRFKLINGLALGAIRARQIGFNCTAYLGSFPDLQAFRALYIAHKLDYRLRKDVTAFVTNLFQERSFDDFAKNVGKYRRGVSREAIHQLYTQFLGSVLEVGVSLQPTDYQNDRYSNI